MSRPDLEHPPKLGPGTQALFDVIRGKIPAYTDDREAGEVMADGVALVQSTELRDAIEGCLKAS